MRKLKVNDFFCGCGGLGLAFQEAGYEIVGAWDFDKFAVETYRENVGDHVQKADIKELHQADIPQADVWAFGFPCFTGDSMVLTENGYTPIINIKPGDKVLTHKNRYKTVLKALSNGKHEIFKIKGMCVDEIRTTENHKFLVRTKKLFWNNEKRVYTRKFNAPEWKEVKNLTKNDYLGIAINQNSIIPKWNGVLFKRNYNGRDKHVNDLSEKMQNGKFWWLVGRYFADGWLREKGVVFGIGRAKADLFEQATEGTFHFTKSEEKTVNKYIVSSKELVAFLKQFGKGAMNKHLTNTILDLPPHLLDHFLKGYFSGDGWYCNNIGVYKFCSVSRLLIYGIGQCIAKCYRRPFSIYKTEPKPTHVIDGRTVQQNDIYSLTFKKENRKQDKAFFENGYIWFPLQSIEKCGTEEVFDIEVEEDHSFTVQNTIVHNCQDLSVAGKQKGMILKCQDCGEVVEINPEEYTGENTCPKCGGKDLRADSRSGCFFEIMRLLEETEREREEAVPAVIIAENVRGLKPYIPVLCMEYEKRGYTAHVQMFNSKYWGVPQSRERYAVIGTRNKLGLSFIFPEEQHDFVPKLSDFLEKEVPEKYYLSDEKAQTIIQQALQKLESLGKCHACITPDRVNKQQNGPRAKAEEEPMFTLTAQDIHGVIVLDEPLPITVAVNKNGRNVLKLTDVSPCLTARDYKGYAGKKDMVAVIEEQEGVDNGKDSR